MTEGVGSVDERCAGTDLDGHPSVAERTAARTAPEPMWDNVSSTVGSDQIGEILRYRPCLPPFHHTAPNPSALMVPPPRISRGAHDCRISEFSPSWMSSRTERAARDTRGADTCQGLPEIVLAQRKPEKIWRLIGWSQLRNVPRQATLSVPNDPPRNTL